MDRLGLGYETLAKINPRLIYASISGYGADGPWVHRRAYATVIGAESGMTRMQGDARGGNYSNDPWSHADTYTALETTTAILAALFNRERSGNGERIDVSMAETMLYVNEHVHDELYDGVVDPNWIRSFQPGDYPIMQVADGSTVVISGHPAERGTFEIIVNTMDRPQLLSDPRFADVQMRLRNLGALQDEMRAWALTLPTAQAFEDRCAQFGLAVGVMRSVREIAESDWSTARGAITSVPDRIGGEVRIPNAPWHFTHSHVGTSGEPRYRGEDNRNVLRDILHMNDEEINALEANKVLSSRFPKTS
jgi:crotonobetainyl-CoA:carnitine CoA-transferase CaiB-like acyl-CoA transferase